MFNVASWRCLEPPKMITSGTSYKWFLIFPEQAGSSIRSLSYGSKQLLAYFFMVHELLQPATARGTVWSSCKRRQQKIILWAANDNTILPSIRSHGHERRKVSPWSRTLWKPLKVASTSWGFLCPGARGFLKKPGTHRYLGKVWQGNLRWV